MSQVRLVLLLVVASVLGATAVAVAQTPVQMMPPGHGGASGAAAAPTQVTFDLVALRATQEGKTSPDIPSDLGWVGAVLGVLPFDTYETISQGEHTAPNGAPTNIGINAEYSFNITPFGANEQGVVDVALRIVMADGRNAYQAPAQLATGKPLAFRGLTMDEGEMVVLVRLKQEDGDGESSSPEASETPPEDEEGEEKEGEAEQQESDSEGQEDQEQGTPEEREEGEEPKDLKNLEALLQSLEDLDRREQEEARNQRDRIRLKGDWW